VRAWAGALVGVLMAANAIAAVKATLDSNQVGVGEPVRLVLQYDGQTREQPDLAPLQQDFDILSTSRSNNMQIINGTVSSHTETQMVIAPKRAGQVLVPSISWAGESSNSLTLIVSATAAPQPESVFLETIVDQKEPYVQAAVNVTVRVYTGEQLLQASLEFTGNGDALVQQVGTDQNRRLEKNGHEYDVVERHYVLFPQKSGELKLPGAQLAGQVLVRLRPDRQSTDPFADLFGAASGLAAGSKPIRVHGDDIILRVRAQPSGVDARYWLPARKVTLTDKWHPDNAEVHVGDPITRDLHLQVEGLTAAQLPDLAALASLPAGIKAYPDQAKLENTVQGDTVIGKRDQSVAMIADQAGKFVLEPLRLTWWDTQANQSREAILPGRTFTILPATGGATTQPPAATTSSVAGDRNTAAAPSTAAAARGGALRDPWLWISVALAQLWLGTVLAWVLSRRPPREIAPLSAPKARAQFQAACRRNDAHAARTALLAWAATAWPESPPRGLAALAKRVGDDKASALLLQLGRSLYRGAAWNGAPLADAINELPPRRDGAGGSGNADGDGLAPLYR
jgi:hypothetical protein